jgi:hypothetical protein
VFSIRCATTLARFANDSQKPVHTITLLTGWVCSFDARRH